MIILKYLTIYFALMAILSTEGISTPQECRDKVVEVGFRLGFKKPLWELSNTEISELKKRAKEQGLWKQFAKICNAWPADKCKSCKCGRDFSDDSCSPNCACCWSGESCASNTEHKMSDKRG